MCNSLLTTLGTLLARICSQKTFLNCHDVQSVTLSCVQLPQLPTFHLTDTRFQKKIAVTICSWVRYVIQGSFSLLLDEETKRQRDKVTK